MHRTRGLHLLRNSNWLGSFEKRHFVLLDKFPRDSRRYRDKGYFSSRSPSTCARVTGASCLELMLQSAPIPHRSPRCYVICHRVISNRASLDVPQCLGKSLRLLSS